GFPRALTRGAAVPAFPPAPFPKSARRDANVSFALAHLQGKWKITSFATYDANGQKRQSTLVEGVRVEGALWTFLNLDGSNNCKYTLTIDGNRNPASIDFYSADG